jgi:hypothetical protein
MVSGIGHSPFTPRYSIVPLLFLVGVLLFLPLVFLVLLPISLVQRYRVGTSRQQARGWLLTLNLAGIVLSTGLFLFGALVSSYWIPNAFTYSLAGIGVGCALGLVGLLLTRWEATPRALHYTPNRLLVLAITLVITARVIYGLWRAWHTWGLVAQKSEWIVVSGVAESMGAGAVVLGYYLVYWAGVRRRLKRSAAPRRV